MSTKRDLVEAHAFSRRRLVTAFVSGAPGGREVEPNRPGRAIIGGVALAILLVAGAAIAGVFSPRTPANWRDSGIVIAKESGNNYVVIENGDPLRPTDPVSARLIFGSDTEVRNVAQDEINKVEIGDDIGIFGAPDSLPSTGLLVDSGWSACMNDQGGAQFRIDSSPATQPAPSAAVTVTGSGGKRYLVASSGNGSGAYRLDLGTGRTANGILARLGLASAPSYDVPDEWLNLFPSGPALSEGSFGVSGAGKPAPYADQLGDASLRIGQLVTLRRQDLRARGDRADRGGAVRRRGLRDHLGRGAGRGRRLRRACRAGHRPRGVARGRAGGAGRRAVRGARRRRGTRLAHPAGDLADR